MLDRPRVDLLTLMRRDLSLPALRVYVVLEAHANGERICWPTMATIASTARIDRRNAQRALADLERAGVVTRQLGGGRHKPNLYRIETAAAPPADSGAVDSGAVDYQTQKQRRTGHETAANWTRNSGVLSRTKQDRSRTEAGQLSGTVAPRVTRVTRDDGDDADPESDFALTPPPEPGAERRLPEEHPDVVAFVAAWGRAYKAGAYPVAFVWPRTAKGRAARAAEIRACQAQSPDWIDTLCTALDMPLIRGEVAPTQTHPHPKPWGPDRILRHWERIVSGEWTSPSEDA